MTIADKISEVINNYVSHNGTETIMTRDELFEMIKDVYPMESGSFIASDFCYNRTNEGLNFNTHVHVFEYISYSKYRLLGEKYDYTGPVYYRKRGETNDSIYGYWNSGVFLENDTASEIDNHRADDLTENLLVAMKMYPIKVEKHGLTIEVNSDTATICRITILPETYKLSTQVASWENQTSYFTTIDSESCNYFLETIDECIGETQRLISFCARKTDSTANKKHTSELSKIVTAETFKNAFEHFLAQAEDNAKTGKSKGSRMPYGISAIIHINGETTRVSTHFGQGAASKTPYMNWWVVSNYYIVESGRIVTAIEEERYSHIKEMEPIRYEMIGAKKTRVAVFYETTRESIDYNDFYEHFINVCEEVMTLGVP